MHRREFLKLGGIGFGSLAINPLRVLLPPEDQVEPLGIGRVTVSSIGVYKEPDLKSEKLDQRFRDELVTLVDGIVSPYGPDINPRWYRVVGGYSHSAYIQRVETATLSTPAKRIRKSGQLGEICVPFTQSWRQNKSNEEWDPLYRLYFQSVHWVTGIEEGPDDNPWYRLHDELLRIEYHVPASHVRLVDDEELTPLSPEVPEGAKSILVKLTEQTLTAFEENEVVLHTHVSTGLPSLGPVTGIPTETPRGIFNIDPKVPSKHMGNGQLTSEVGAYELPGVPWTCFFEHETGIAFHGTYWHDNFGGRMSHGCVNMRVEDAKWLYRWSTPVAKASDWTRNGFGTRVEVI
ncbi:MAG: L,D-transpeptidase [Chloroflexota bacterium]|nr:MAG: L,D-transpeptidase [Chloroflexota bacterium]